ncbi:hypothetical protein GCM10023066_32800 [Nocardioides kongjuensis]
MGVGALRGVDGDRGGGVGRAASYGVRAGLGEQVRVHVGHRWDGEARVDEPGQRLGRLRREVVGRQVTAGLGQLVEEGADGRDVGEPEAGTDQADLEHARGAAQHRDAGAQQEGPVRHGGSVARAPRGALWSSTGVDLDVRGPVENTPRAAPPQWSRP